MENFPIFTYWQNSDTLTQPSHNHLEFVSWEVYPYPPAILLNHTFQTCLTSQRSTQCMAIKRLLLQPIKPEWPHWPRSFDVAMAINSAHPVIWDYNLGAVSCLCQCLAKCDDFPSKCKESTSHRTIFSMAYNMC